MRKENKKETTRSLSVKIQDYRGYSLIEMLLVIAISGVVAMMIINSLQQREQEIKVRKTVLQIEQIFLSANAYHIVKGYWPTNKTEEFESDYVPKGVLSGPWGNTYVYNPQLIDGTEKRFRVETKVTNYMLAKQVSIMLPNAKVLGDSVTVAAEIPLSFDRGEATVSGMNLMAVRNIQISHTNDFSNRFRFDNQGVSNVQIDNVACGTMQKPMVIVMPGNYRMLKGSQFSDFYLRAAPDIASIGVKNIDGDPYGFNYYYQAWVCSDTHQIDQNCDSPAKIGPLSGLYKGGDSRVLFSNGGVNLNYLVFCVPNS